MEPETEIVLRTDEEEQSRMLHALRLTLGNVTRASVMTDISPETHYAWLNTHAAYRNAVEFIENKALDEVESRLYDLIGKGNISAIIFYLKTKGRRRGYTERGEQPAVAGKGPVVFNVQVKSPEEAEWLKSL